MHIFFNGFLKYIQLINEILVARIPEVIAQVVTMSAAAIGGIIAGSFVIVCTSQCGYPTCFYSFFYCEDVHTYRPSIFNTRKKLCCCPWCGLCEANPSEGRALLADNRRTNQPVHTTATQQPNQAKFCGKCGPSGKQERYVT